MKFLTVATALFILSLTASHADESDATAAAEAAADAWLSLADEGRFGDSWHQASSLFRAGISESDWERAMSAARLPLGSIESRELASATYSTTLPGAPDGEYVVLQFESSFGNKESAVETITVMKDTDASWRISGYYIR